MNDRELEIRFYRPIDELEQTPKVLVLRTLRRCGWVETSELYALIADGVPRNKRDAIASVITRFVRYGWIDRRGGRCSSVYRLSDLGRRELEHELDRAFNPVRYARALSGHGHGSKKRRAA